MAFVRESHKPPNRVKDLGHRAICDFRIAPCNVFAYVFEVREGPRMERVGADYDGPLRCASVFAFKREKASSPSMGFTRPPREVVIATVPSLL